MVFPTGNQPQTPIFLPTPSATCPPYPFKLKKKKKVCSHWAKCKIGKSHLKEPVTLRGATALFSAQVSSPFLPIKISLQRTPYTGECNPKCSLFPHLFSP